jgi:hypothetical protein
LITNIKTGSSWIAKNGRARGPPRELDAHRHERCKKEKRKIATKGKAKPAKKGKTLRKLEKLEANKPLIVAKYSP